MHLADAFTAAFSERPIRYATDAELLHGLHSLTMQAAPRGSQTDAAESHDRLPSLVFADHLDETDRPQHAAFVREAMRQHEENGGHDPFHSATTATTVPLADWPGFERTHAYASPLTTGDARVYLWWHVGSDDQSRRFLRHHARVPAADVHATLDSLESEGADVTDARTALATPAEQPEQMQRDGDPAIRRKLNVKHQKARAARNRQLTPAELAARIRDLVAKTPRTLSKVQSSLRLDGKTTAAAIEHGERAGLLRTVPTARGRRVEPHGGPSPHPTPPEAPPVDAARRFAREFAVKYAAERNDDFTHLGHAAHDGLKRGDLLPVGVLADHLEERDHPLAMIARKHFNSGEVGGTGGNLYRDHWDRRVPGMQRSYVVGDHAADLDRHAGFGLYVEHPEDATPRDSYRVNAFIYNSGADRYDYARLPALSATLTRDELEDVLKGVEKTQDTSRRSPSLQHLSDDEFAKHMVDHTRRNVGLLPPEPHQFAREFARHFAAYRAPEGGVSVKGLYYPGGQLVPDLTKFAAEPREAEEVPMHATGSYRGSQQFKPVRTAEEQVIRPAGGSYRGSQQLQLLPPRPNGLRLLTHDAPKPPTPDQQRLDSLIKGWNATQVKATPPPRSQPAERTPPPVPWRPGIKPPKPKSQPGRGQSDAEIEKWKKATRLPPKAKTKDDGVPIRTRTRDSKRTLLDRLRRVIAKHLQPK